MEYTATKGDGGGECMRVSRSDPVDTVSAVGGGMARNGGARAMRDTQTGRAGMATARSTRGFALGFILLLTVALVGQALTGTVNELNSGMAAYLVGESYWSKSREGATLHLYRYSIERDAALLEHARRMLDVQLGDRDARLALDREPPDIEAAYAGFERGMNPRSNLARIVWLYRWFGFVPAFHDAIERWRETDRSVLRMAALAAELEDAVRTSDESTIGRLRGELSMLDGEMRALQLAFLDAMVRADRWMGRMLVLFSALGFTVLAAVAALLLRVIVRRVRASEGGFRAAFEQAAIGMVRVGADGRLLAVNGRICGILGRSEAELLGVGFDRLDGSDGRSGLRALRERLFASGDASVTEERDFRSASGAGVRIKLTASMIRDQAPGSEGMLALIEDVSDTLRLTRELEHHASHDALTGLANRRELQRSLTHLLARARRDDSRHALLLLDIDQFKLVNDSCGPAAGDEYLRRIAARLSLELESRCLLARVGGDEFAVVQEAASLADAEALAGQLARLVSDTAFRWGTLSFMLTASIGIVEISAEAGDSNGLLRAVDIACGLAKDQGRNRVRVYVDADEAVARRRNEAEWVNEVRAALAERRLFLFAQPIRDLQGHGGLRYELLARLMDRAGRLHEPGAFIPATERYGQIGALDREVVRLALDSLAGHPGHLGELESCHINVSAQSMASPEFREYLVQRIVDAGVPGTKLCFELTETAAVSNLNEARAFIAAVQALGCKVALDDFGSGMSSFGYLKALPVDILKIDGVFARDAATDPLDRSVLHAIGSIGHALGKYTIAEWVESDGVREILRELGIDAAQGYALGRPQPFESLLRPASGIHAGDAVGA